jgi:hypothetical protein
MKPTTLILRCYVEKQGSQWLAFCLDLCLASQADSLLEAKEKLQNQISEYVYDALMGEDQDFAEQLLRRRAPLVDWLKYYSYVWLSQVGAIRREMWQKFATIMPLVPASPPAWV